MLTGIETSIAFLHSPRTEMRFGSISKVRADARELLAGQLEGVLAQVGRRCDCQGLLLLSLQTGGKT